MTLFMAIVQNIFNGLISILRNIRTFLYVILWGLWNFLKLLIIFLSCMSDPANFKKNLIKKITSPVGLRSVMACLRAFLPTILLNKKFITAYENNATALVMAYEDVLEIVNQDEIFETVYAPKMNLLTRGDNFFLGMQNSPDYSNNEADMRLAVNRDDIPKIIMPFVRKEVNQIMDDSGGKLDIPQELMLPVLARMVGTYFGSPGTSEQDLIRWTHQMFHYIFFDFFNDKIVIKGAEQASEACRDYLDNLIRERKVSPSAMDDVLGRCLKLQEANMPFMDDVGIRNNFIGMLTAMVPTISNATTRVLDQLLERPDILARAQAAARSDDDALLLRYIMEAFRFNPMNPVIFRVAVQDHILAAGTLRQRKIPKGCFVFAANLSAMFDPWVIPHAGQFDINRPDDHYILWGMGMHRCFGDHISKAVMPQFLKPLLKRNTLRRAAGKAGMIDTEETPFPKHMHVLFD